MSVALPVAAYSQTAEHEEGGEEEGEVFLDIKPKIKNAIFNDPAEIAYDIKVKSTYKEVQEGKVSYELKTDYGKHVFTDSVKVKIGPGGSKKLSFKIPAKTPGGGSPVSAVAPGTNNYIWPIPNSEALYNRGL